MKLNYLHIYSVPQTRKRSRFLRSRHGDVSVTLSPKVNEDARGGGPFDLGDDNPHKSVLPPHRRDDHSRPPR